MSTQLWDGPPVLARPSIGLVIVQVTGVLLLCFCVMLVAPVIVSLLYADGLVMTYIALLAASLPAGSVMLAYSLRRPARLRIRDGFVVVALLWFTLSLLGSLPLYLCTDLGYAEAFFESASGVTTTGSTVIVGIDELPESILFFRQELQWFGGIGVIVSAIALLPVLGLGGMQMMKAETPGPVKGEKLTPRIVQTARFLWTIYLALTILCAGFYWFAGMDAFDAIAHSMSTVSTGGYSTHDASMAYFDSPAIESVAIVFMLLGAISFAVHFTAWANLDPLVYFRNEEVRSFLILVAAVTAIGALILHHTGTLEGIDTSARYAIFQVVSVITSTGYTTTDFSVWPHMLPVLLIFTSFVGGCAGSTAGGMKVVRFLVMGRQAQIEVHRLIHPKMVRPLRLDGRTLPDSVVRSVWAFFTTYMLVFAALMMVLMWQGMDQVTAFGAVATCLNNLGPGLGDVAMTFASIGDVEKYVLAFATIAGRLEIFTILVLLTPAFWKE